jgi:hypothetical protein
MHAVEPAKKVHRTKHPQKRGREIAIRQTQRYVPAPAALAISVGYTVTVPEERRRRTPQPSRVRLQGCHVANLASYSNRYFVLPALINAGLLVLMLFC